MTNLRCVGRPTAIVNGVHSQLTEAVARALALSGFRPMVTAAEQDEYGPPATPFGATAVGVDITSDASVRSFVSTLRQVSVLVIAHAEELPYTTTAADIHDRSWRWETQIRGKLRLLKALVPHLVESDGLVVTVSAHGSTSDLGREDPNHSPFSELTLHRLIAAEIDTTPIRFTRIRSTLSENTASGRSSVTDDRTSLSVPSQMPSLTADDVAEVVAFVATRPASAPLLLEEVVIR